jgi:F0F1-type ATP synthase beta subunit
MVSQMHETDGSKIQIPIIMNISMKNYIREEDNEKNLFIDNNINFIFKL